MHVYIVVYMKMSCICLIQIKICSVLYNAMSWNDTDKINIVIKVVVFLFHFRYDQISFDNTLYVSFIILLH